MKNKGKDFEQFFKRDFIKTFPKYDIIRLKDTMSGYKMTSRNISDFVLFLSDRLVYAETKTHLGNTFPWSAFSQYDLMLEKYYEDKSNVYCGVFVWFQDHQRVIYVPIEECEKMKNDGLKSINITKLDFEKY